MKERNYYCHLKNDKKIWKYLSVHAIISCIFSYYIKIEKKIGLGDLCVEIGIEVNRETASIAIKMERKGIGGVAKAVAEREDTSSRKHQYTHQVAHDHLQFRLLYCTSSLDSASQERH